MALHHLHVLDLAIRADHGHEDHLAMRARQTRTDSLVVFVSSDPVTSIRKTMSELEGEYTMLPLRSWARSISTFSCCAPSEIASTARVALLMALDSRFHVSMSSPPECSTRKASGEESCCGETGDRLARCTRKPGYTNSSTMTTSWAAASTAMRAIFALQRKAKRPVAGGASTSVRKALGKAKALFSGAGVAAADSAISGAGTSTKGGGTGGAISRREAIGTICARAGGF